MRSASPGIPVSTWLWGRDQSGELILWNMKTQQYFIFVDIPEGSWCRHGREGMVSLFDMQATSTAKYQCASLTFMKASLASQNPPILFVPGENDSVQLSSGRDSPVLDFTSWYPCFWTFAVSQLKQNERNGHVLFGNPAESLCSVLWVRPCLHNRWKNTHDCRGSTGVQRAKWIVLTSMHYSYQHGCCERFVHYRLWIQQDRHGSSSPELGPKCIADGFDSFEWNPDAVLPLG